MPIKIRKNSGKTAEGTSSNNGLKTSCGTIISILITIAKSNAINPLIRLIQKLNIGKWPFPIFLIK